MKKRLQGIGIGLFLAGAIFTIASQYSSYKAESNDEEMKQLRQQLAAVEQELANANEKNAQNQLDETNQEKTNNNEQNVTVEDATTNTEEITSNEPTSSNPSIKSGIIFVYEGVSLYDIGKQAEDLGIVQNGRELELYLYKPEYARSIQKGQFELDSTMSLEQMAKVLTGKK